MRAPLRGLLRGPGRDLFCGGEPWVIVRWLRHRLCCQSRAKQLGMLSLRGLQLGMCDVVPRGPVLCWSWLGREVLCGFRASPVLCSSRGKRLLQSMRKSMRPSESIREVLGVVSLDMSVQHMSLHSVAEAHVSMVSMPLPECFPARRARSAFHHCTHDLRKT